MFQICITLCQNHQLELNSCGRFANHNVMHQKIRPESDNWCCETNCWTNDFNQTVFRKKTEIFITMENISSYISFQFSWIHAAPSIVFLNNHRFHAVRKLLANFLRNGDENFKIKLVVTAAIPEAFAANDMLDPTRKWKHFVLDIDITFNNKTCISRLGSTKSMATLFGNDLCPCCGKLSAPAENDI